MRCGFRPDQIVFTGVGKSAAEIDRAVSLGLLAINVESPGELDRIDQRAIAQGARARVALRVNPDIDAKSHPHISTGLKSNKFGVPIDEAPALFREMSSRRGLLPIGAHVHIGSQITTLDPLSKAAEAVVALARDLRSDGIELQHLDMGGGLGISYDGSPVVDPARLRSRARDGHARQRPEGGDRARPRARRSGGRAARRRSSTSSSSRARSASSCSMPA